MGELHLTEEIKIPFTSRGDLMFFIDEVDYELTDTLYMHVSVRDEKISEDLGPCILRGIFKSPEGNYVTLQKVSQLEARVIILESEVEYLKMVVESQLSEEDSELGEENEQV